MVSPEVPTGSPVGQTVFNCQADRHRYHAVGIVALWQGQLRHVGIEVDVALGAMMNRVGNVDIVRATRNQVSQVMQHPLCAAMPIGAMSALWTKLSSKTAATFDDLRLGKILDARNAFRGIRHVHSRSWHGTALLGNPLQAPNLAKISSRVIIKTQ